VEKFSVSYTSQCARSGTICGWRDCVIVEKLLNNREWDAQALLAGIPIGEWLFADMAD